VGFQLVVDAVVRVTEVDVGAEGAHVEAAGVLQGELQLQGRVLHGLGDTAPDVVAASGDFAAERPGRLGLLGEGGQGGKGQGCGQCGCGNGALHGEDLRPGMGEMPRKIHARAGGVNPDPNRPGGLKCAACNSSWRTAVSLRLATLASALILAACGGSQGGAEANTLNVYNWSDYVAPDTIANFEAATGIRVNYDVYSENETLETKLVAGGSGYDVVFPSARPFAQRQIRSGLYAALDKSQLPNLAHMDPEIMEGLTDIDPGNAHLVPYMWGTTGLGINVARVQEALGADAPLDSWGLLFDPANASRLASCGIHLLDDDQGAFGAALIWLGRDPNAGSPDEIDAVREAYAAIRPHI